MATAALSKVAELNDALRKTFVGGNVVTTAAVAAMSDAARAKVLTAVQHFGDFNADNDPHGEHDCAFITVEGEQYFFKLEYYDPTMQFGSEDPADPSQATRVLTIGTAADF